MSDKQEYEALKLKLIEIEEALKHRCVECSNFNAKKNECFKHGFVPADFIYSRNDCEYWDWLPFKFVEL